MQDQEQEQEQEQEREIPLDQYIATYIKIRDHRHKLKEDFASEDARLDIELKLIEAKLLYRCKELGADSIKTPVGTIIRSIKYRYWTSDWLSMYDFISEHNAFGLLEKRLHQGNFKQFLTENPSIKPMGLNIDSEYTVVVRRK